MKKKKHSGLQKINMVQPVLDLLILLFAIAKSSFSTIKQLKKSVLLFSVIFLSVSISLSATTRTWDNGDGDNDWDSDANWNANGNAPGERANDDSDDVAVFRDAGHTAEIDVRKNGDDSYDFYLKELKFDTTQDWYLDHHHNDTYLRFDAANGGTNSLINVDGSGSHTIQARVKIRDVLEINQNSSGVLTFEGHINATEGLEIRGTGVTEFSTDNTLTINVGTSVGEINIYDGIMTVKNSFEVTNVDNRLYVGRDNGADGVLNIDGAGTSVELEQGLGDLRVGATKSGTASGTVNITNDGYMKVESQVNLGGHDADNFWGHGVMNISSGGDLDARTELRLGTDAGGSTGELTVDGAGSTVDVDSHTYIGRHGTGTITVQNDADFTANGDVYVGEGQDANGDGSLIVSGSGSTFTTTGGTDDLFVGHDQGEGRVVASNTAAITVTGLFSVGDDTSNAKGFVTIESGASLDLATTSYIGRFGTGQVMVTGSNSTMTIASNQLSVGRDGSGEGRLEIASGALLTATAASTTTYIARGSNSNGSFYVTGNGTTALIRALIVGADSNSYGVVTVSSGGDVSLTAESYIGENGTGTMTVTGDGSTLTSTTHLNVGTNTGSVGELTLSNSATLTASDRIYVGDNAASQGTVSIVSGADAVINGFAYLGNNGTGTVVVSGSGSTFTGVDRVFIGTGNGSVGQFTLSNSATLTASNRLYVGTDAGSQGTVSILSGADATTNSQTYLGNNSTGTIVVTGNGSTYTGSDHMYIGVGSTGVGKLALSNSAAVTANKDFSIGDTSGSNGVVTLESGGDVNVGWTTYVGKASTGALTVTGTNSSFASSGDIILGNASTGVGTLTISSNGTVETNGKIKIGIAGGSGGTGTLTLQTDNGIVDASDMELGGGTFNPEGVTQASGGLGNLTMTEDSIIDMDGGNSVINWSVIDENTWTGTLLVHNWDGNRATGGNDQLIFSDITGFNLANTQVLFYSDAGTTELGYGMFKANGGNWELVPAPEPTTLIGIFMLTSFGIFFEIKRRRNFRQH